MSGTDVMTLSTVYLTYVHRQGAFVIADPEIRTQRLMYTPGIGYITRFCCLICDISS